MFKAQSSLLFTPIKVGKIELRNRLALMPITTQLDEDDKITDRYIKFYEARARGGVGILFTGMMSVVSTRDATIRGPGIYDEEFIPDIKRFTDAVHHYDVPIIAQIGLLYEWRTSYDAPVEWVAPSPVPIHKRIPRKLSVPEIKKIIEQFGEAVRLAKTGGFDGAEILACQGSLINRFISPLTNRRTDEYGGGLGNRMRMLSQIIETVKEKVGDDFALSCRLSVDELMDGGLTVQDYLPVCELLQQAGLHCLNVEVGWHESTVPHLQSSVTPGSLTYPAQAVKKAVDIPVITAQRINSAAVAEGILARGEADIIGMARGLIADPELPNKAMRGRLDEVRPCICCMRCNESVVTSSHICCSVNPQVGREGQDDIVESQKRKTVVVVGGGPAGMQAALTASARGHGVEIMEQRNELGGPLIEAAIPPYKSELMRYVNYLRNRIERINIHVELGKRADIKKLNESNPDVVILATGSRPVIPDLIGINREKVFTASDILRHPEKCRQKVVVVGGGFIGCETAEFLAQRGKTVTIVEMLKRIANDIGSETRWVVLKRLGEAGAAIEADSTVVEISEEGVVAIKDGSKRLFPADTVIIAVGRRPDNELEKQVRRAFPQSYSIGDCVSVRRILEAVEQGYSSALKV